MARQISSFKFGWRQIDYYDYDFPTAMPAKYYMEVDLKLIEKYMHLKAGDTFVDVGATFGSWSLPALCQGANVIAIEPHHTVAICLLENASLNSWDSRLKLIYRAAWSEGDKKIPYRYFSMSSFLNKNEFSDVEPVYINTMTIDSLNLERIDLMKIDVEGAEKEVLGGARKSLERCRPDIILENHVDLIGVVDIEDYYKRELEDGKFLFTSSTLGEERKEVS